MKLNYYIYSFIASLMLAFTACTPEDFDLGAKSVTADDLVEGIAYTITHDSENPNIVYLESKMPNSYTALWEHPQGRSQEKKVTLRIPFEGTYTVTFGVETRGGAVYGEPVTFKVDEFCADFVNDELWTFLTGGVGNSKTWVYDDGNYGYATGEVDYSDPSQPLGWGIPASGWLPGKGHTGDNNIWDSYMTFDLNGGANVTIHNTYTDGETLASRDETGTFMLDVDNHTITFTDCKIMHTQGWDSKTLNWSSGLTLVALDENHLQVGVMRGGKDVSGEDPWWLVWNFVSKDWADNYVPADKPDPIPEIDGDANEVITTSKSKTWALSIQSPFDWASLDGALLSGFTKPEDYDNGWAAYNADMISATRFVFTATDAAGGKYSFSSYQNEDIEGSYTIDANNDIIFDQSLNALISHTNYGWDSNMFLTTTADNKLRIIKTKTDVMGNVTDIWLGCRSTEKDEYIAYHFEVGAGGSSPIDQDKIIKERLTGGNSRTYRLDYEHIICTWAVNHAYDNITDGKKENYASSTLPDWTGWIYSDSNIANVDKFRLTFKNDGSMVFVNNKGENTSTTYSYLSADDWYGMPLIQFPENVDMFFELTGNEGGWLNFELQFNKEKTNDDGTVAPPVGDVPQGGGFLEIYDWDMDADGNITGLWLGMDNGNGAESLKNIANQRKVFHLLVVE